jgi:hypothetical protein
MRGVKHILPIGQNFLRDEEEAMGMKKCNSHSRESAGR